MARGLRIAAAVLSTFVLTGLVGGCAGSKASETLGAAPGGAVTPLPTAGVSVSATTPPTGTCPLPGELGAICGVRYVATMASGGQDPASVASTPTTVEFTMLNAKPTLVLVASQTAVNAPVTVTGTTLVVDLSSAAQTDILVADNSSLAWMREFLRSPLHLDVAASASTLELSSSGESATFRAE